MVEVLNKLDINAACVGNHEFDFGAAHFAYLAKQCNFPWLLSNIFDPDLGDKKPLGNCQQTLMLTTSNKIKVGLMGLVEKEWTEKINNSLPSDIEHFDMKETAKKLAPELREQGADVVIAITHARQARDYDLCENIHSGLVDVVLAGHDHWVEHKELPNGTIMIRSGYDFKNLTYSEGYRQENGSWKFSTVRRNLNGEVAEDASVNEVCQGIVADIHRKMEMPLGLTAVPLEARHEKCQMQESNFGNFLADLMRTYHKADCALINGGTFFGDTIYPSGQLILKDVVKCFSFEDPVVTLRLNGRKIKEALENGVSKYPEPDSRFPQVSNIFFTFDPTRKSGDRITKVSIGGEDLNMQREYTIATRSHLAAGKAGYDALKSRRDGGEATELIDEENGVLVTGLIRQYFTWIQITDAFKGLSGGDEAKMSHRQQVISSLGRHSARWRDEEDRMEMVKKKVVWKWKRLTFKESDLEKLMQEGDGEFFPGWTKGIAPKLEGRSRCVVPN